VFHAGPGAAVRLRAPRLRAWGTSRNAVGFSGRHRRFAAPLLCHQNLLAMDVMKRLRSTLGSSSLVLQGTPTVMVRLTHAVKLISRTPSLSPLVPTADSSLSRSHKVAPVLWDFCRTCPFVWINLFNKLKSSLVMWCLVIQIPFLFYYQ